MAHYMKPLPTNEQLQEYAEAFWSRVNKTDYCWEWVGSLYDDRYGQFCIRRKRYRAHRVAWVLTVGEIPPGLGVLHKCDNPKCVNPDHLFLGTQVDNMCDCSSKGRLGMQKHPQNSSFNHLPSELRPRGVGHGNSILTDEEVLSIVGMAGANITQDAIANLYGISSSTVRDILHGRTWRHVTHITNGGHDDNQG